MTQNTRHEQLRRVMTRQPVSDMVRGFAVLLALLATFLAATDASAQARQQSLRMALPEVCGQCMPTCVFCWSQARRAAPACGRACVSTIGRALTMCVYGVDNVCMRIVCPKIEVQDSHLFLDHSPAPKQCCSRESRRWGAAKHANNYRMLSRGRGSAAPPLQ